MSQPSSGDESQQLTRRALLSQVAASASANTNANGAAAAVMQEPDENENEPDEPDENAPLNTTTTTKTTTIITTIATPAPNASSSSNSNSANANANANSNIADAKVNTTVVIEKTTNATSSDGSADLGQSGGFTGSDEPPMSVGMIVGITLAGAATIVLVAFMIVRYFRKRRAYASDADAKDSFGANERTPHTSAEYTGNLNLNASSAAAGRSGGSNSNSAAIRSKESSLWDDDEIVALRIPLEKVVISSLLSRGGYGEVYYGTYKDQQVAIKTLLPHMRKDLHQINSFLAETKLMAALEHPNIVRFIGVAWDSLTDLCVVSEYMEGGDLRALLTRFETQERRPHGFDHDKVKIAFHVAHAITYLHSLDPIVLHRDLKSKNILLDSQLDAKVTDFGVSRESSDKTMTAGVGTSLWMAPEVMMGERYDDKADIFSFGVVLSELDSHGLPYAQAKSTDSGRQLPDTAILQMVSLGRLKIQLSGNAPQAIADLAAACTSLDPRDRPSAVQVVYKLQVVLKTYTDFVF